MMSSSSYTDKKAIASSRNFVNVVLHQETSHSVQATYGKDKKSVCKDYANLNSDITCDDHKNLYDKCDVKSVQKVRGVPATIIMSTNLQDELYFHEGGLSGMELSKKLDEISKKQGNVVPYDVYAGAKKWAAEGDDFLGKDEYKKAVESYAKITKITAKGAEKLKKLGEDGLAKCNEKGESLLQDAISKKESDPAEAKKLLQKIERGFSPLEASKKAKQELASMK